MFGIQRTLRFAWPLAVVLFGCGAALPALSQTAHFSYAESDVATGLNTPDGVAVDSSGNVYIGDLGNARVLKETLSGNAYTQSTVGSGWAYPYGVAVDAGGNVYVGDYGKNGVVKETPSSGSYVPSIVGAGFTPDGVAVDASGNVYIADYEDGRVLEEIFSAGSYTQKVVTVGNAIGVAVDSSGSVYIAEPQNGVVFKETPSSGSYVQSTVASGLYYPDGVAVDSGGNVYIAGGGNGQVLKETPSSGTYTQSVVISGLSNPGGVALDSQSNLYVSDAYGGGRVLVLQTSSVNFGTQDLGSAGSALALTFTFDSAGTLGSYSVLTQGLTGLHFTDAGGGTCTAGGTYAANQTCTVNVSFVPKSPGLRNGAVVLYNSAGTPLATAYVNGTGSGPQVAFSPSTQSSIGSGTNFPLGAAVDAGGNVYIADTYNNRVLKGQTPVVTGLNSPYSVAVDGGGNLYIADTYYQSSSSSPFGRVIKETQLAAGGYTQSVIADGASTPYAMNYPNAVAVDGSGNVYIANTNSSQVLKETLQSSGGYAQSLVADATATPHALNNPKGVAVDGAGDVYIANTLSYQVLKETPTASGSYTQSLIANLPSGYDSPFSVALDGVGNVYFTDAANNQVLEYEETSSSSYAQRMAWSGSQPYGVAVDSSGNVIYTAANSDNVYKVNVAAPQSLAFATTTVGSVSSDSPRTITLSNIGNAALSFPAPSVAGSFNPSIATNFTYGSSSTCMQVDSSGPDYTLAAGASCTELLSFAPQMTGTITGAAVTTDNNLNAASATQSIPLSGTATVGSVTVSVPAASATYGTANTTVAAVISYNGAAPTGAVTFVLNANQNSQQTANCTAAAGARTCTTTYNTSTFVIGSESITVTESADSNYNQASGSGTLTITKATPSLTVVPQSVVYGTAQTAISVTVAYAGSAAPTGALSVTLDNGAAVFATCSGASSPQTCTGVYSIVSLGTGSHVITASLAADTNYLSTSANGTLSIIKAAPVITSMPAATTYGAASTTLAAMVAFSGPAAPTGAVTFAVDAGASAGATCAGTSSPLTCTASYGTSSITAGVHTVTVTIAADANYTAVSGTGVLTVSQATPVITWATPAGIPVGTALSAMQLNATANVPGSFVYTPSAGTVLSAGTQTLTAAFTSADAADYTTASRSISLSVIPYAATPSFVPGAGAYTAAQTVMIADATAGAVIYYTVDGSIPTPGSTRYSAPIAVPSTETIQAIATATGYEASAIGSAMITIYKPPTCTLSVQGTSTALSVLAIASCTDPQGQALTSTLSWGDGTSSAVSARNTHAYASAGTYTVVVTSTDTSGLQGTAQQQITPNQTPICTLGIVQSAASTYAVTVTVSCTDPQKQALTLALDWGDGTGASPASNNAANQHTYAAPNSPSSAPYTVTLTAVDSAGLTSSVTQPVTILPAAAQVSPGGASAVPVSTAMSSSTGGAVASQVTFICSSVSTVINGQAITNALPSQYGISCSAPTVTLSSTPVPVNVTIQTTSASATTSAWNESGSEGVFYAIALPLPTFVSFVLGMLAPARSRRRRSRIAAMGTIVLICVGLSACGGSFVPPPVIPTPVGQYFITIVEVPVGAAAPSGFVQTSLIVPLPIGVTGS